MGAGAGSRSADTGRSVGAARRGGSGGWWCRRAAGVLAEEVSRHRGQRCVQMGGVRPLGPDRCSPAEGAYGQASRAGAAPGTEEAGRCHDSVEIRESPGQVEKSSHTQRLHRCIRRMQLLGQGSERGLGEVRRRRCWGGSMCEQHTRGWKGGTNVLLG